MSKRGGRGRTADRGATRGTAEKVARTDGLALSRSPSYFCDTEGPGGMGLQTHHGRYWPQDLCGLLAVQQSQRRGHQGGGTGRTASEGGGVSFKKISTQFLLNLEASTGTLLSP